MTRLQQESEHRTLLKTERMYDGHDPLRKEATASALGAVGHLSPEHKRTERSLGVIVRRFDASLEREREEGSLVLENVGAGAGETAQTQVYAPLEKVLDRKLRIVRASRCGRRPNSPAESIMLRSPCRSPQHMITYDHAWSRPVKGYEGCAGGGPYAAAIQRVVP